MNEERKSPVLPEFKALTKAEINDLNDEQLESYLTEKQAFDTAVIEKRFFDMETEILENKFDDSAAEVAELKVRLEDTIKELDAMFLMIEQKNETPVSGESYKSIGEALLAEFRAKEDELKDWASTGKRDVAKGPISITVKAVVDMGEENTIGAGATQVTLTENTGMISPIRKREMRYMANVSTGRIGTKRALWIEQTAEDGTPIMLGEGDAKTQLSSLWEEKTADVKKIAVFGKVTTELLADLPQLVSFIQNDLLKRMDIVLEDQLFTGDNTGDNLNGAITLATAFTGGSLAASVDDANEADVIVAVGLQANEAFHDANCVFVHPSKVAKIRLLKGSDGHYLIPRFVSDDQLMIDGIRVIPTTAVGADVFVGGDCTVLNVLIRSELGIQIGLDGNDFTNNKQTMLAEKRVVQYCSANNVAGVITGTFSAAITALETP